MASGPSAGQSRTLLSRDPRVIEYGDAPLEAGGWGATCVTLRDEP
ncbi:MAG: Smr/MutS family protein [Thermoanaerobaculia bacterium]